MNEVLNNNLVLIRGKIYLALCNNDLPKDIVNIVHDIDTTISNLNVVTEIHQQLANVGKYRKDIYDYCITAFPDIAAEINIMMIHHIKYVGNDPVLLANEIKSYLDTYGENRQILLLQLDMQLSMENKNNGLILELVNKLDKGDMK